MRAAGVDLYIIPTTDYHGSEYVNDYFKCREYVSGFTGSAGTLVVEQDFAGLWTDGRYFLQAQQQLDGSGITLMKMGVDGVPDIMEYIESRTSLKTIGFDGRIVSHEMGKQIEKVHVHQKDRHDIGRQKLHPVELQVNAAYFRQRSNIKKTEPWQDQDR